MCSFISRLRLQRLNEWWENQIIYQEGEASENNNKEMWTPRSVSLFFWYTFSPLLQHPRNVPNNCPMKKIIVNFVNCANCFHPQLYWGGMSWWLSLSHNKSPEFTVYFDSLKCNLNYSHSPRVRAEKCVTDNEQQPTVGHSSLRGCCRVLKDTSLNPRARHPPLSQVMVCWTHLPFLGWSSSSSSSKWQKEFDSCPKSRQ